MTTRNGRRGRVSWEAWIAISKREPHKVVFKSLAETRNICLYRLNRAIWEAWDARGETPKDFRIARVRVIECQAPKRRNHNGRQKF